MDKVRIKDLYLASYLKARGIPLDSFEKRHGYTIFIFMASEKAEKLITEFVQDKADVNVKLFRNCLRDLKSLASGDIPIPRNGGKE